MGEQILDELRATILTMQELKIQRNTEALHTIATETTDLMNELGIADLTIKKLRAKLARVEQHIVYTRNQAPKLRLQADRIAFDNFMLSQRYEKALSQIGSRIQQKEQELCEAKLRRKRILKLRDEMKQKNDSLKVQLKNKDGNVTLLKAKLANQSSWNVRNTFSGENVLEEVCNDV